MKKVRQAGGTLMKLPCDNLDDFISGHLKHYAVTGDYKQGDVITLSNDTKEHDFIIQYIHYKGNNEKVLNLGQLKYYWYNSKHNPKADKVAGGMYGYMDEPNYETIEQFDLRFIAYETFDELCDRYF